MDQLTQRIQTTHRNKIFLFSPSSQEQDIKTRLVKIQSRRIAPSLNNILIEILVVIFLLKQYL